MPVSLFGVILKRIINLKREHRTNASSKYQDTLPLSSEELLTRLDAWKISYKRYDHVPLLTVEDSKEVQGLFLPTEKGGGHVKNLNLRDKKSKIFLSSQNKMQKLI